ncbi:MAG: TonB-dependent receptor [Ignavibacteriales bacterium]|nr:TonB-dependent receptor [Ignavibacteriales bacterium]
MKIRFRISDFGYELHKLVSRFAYRTSNLVLLMLFVSVSFLHSQTKGIISGKVTDKRTNEALPAVNILIKGTYYGAASDLDGNYKILNVNPGTYALNVTLLGYKAFQMTGIVVQEGKTTDVDIKLEETSLTLDQEVVVIGEKPLFNIEETSSRRTTKGEDLQAAAIQKVEDAVALQVGVTKSDDEIHIRGGRTYENAYLVNGVSVQDPLSGSGFGLQLGSDAIEEIEVLTGGYNAEYGQATSGIVNTKIKEGSEKYTGSFNYRRDHFGFNATSRSNFNTDIYSASLSGPLGPVKFFGSVDASFSDDFTRWYEKTIKGKPVGYAISSPNGLHSSTFYGSQFAPRQNNRISLLGNLSWRPSSVTKLSLMVSNSVSINQNTKTVQATLERVESAPGFQYLFLHIPDSAATFTSINTLGSLSFVHTLSPKTFYELQFSLYTAHVRGDNNGKDNNGDGKVNWDDYSEPQDIVTFPIDTFRYSPETLRVVPGDGFYDIGSPSVWRDHFIREYGLKADLTHHFTENNKLKTGFESKFQEMRYIDVSQPWIKKFGIDNDKYIVYPASGALYAQNAISISGMILNSGLRLDYWFPGKHVDDAVSDPQKTLVADVLRSRYDDETFQGFDFSWKDGFHSANRRWKARISPRIGISHPISDNQTLFFSYGHFSKLPRPQFVYSKLTATSAKSSSQVVGNPNLNPETTVAYELGFRYQVTENDVLSLTTYYKDIFDYITALTVAFRNPRTRGTYTTYINQDYARSRGAELEYKKRIGNWFRGTLSGSYSIATGKSSSSTEQIFNTGEGRRETTTENFLVWDRPVQITAHLNFDVKKNNPLFGMTGVLEDMTAYVKIFFQSGKRYSPLVFSEVDSINFSPSRNIYREEPKNYMDGIGDNWFYVNVNLEKNFDINFGRLVFNLEIQNLFDNKNSQILNPVTGRAYEYGDDVPLSSQWNDPRYPDLIKPIATFPYNPARYLSPRTFRVGIAFRF